MTLSLQFAAETPPDPIWLRTLATVLPVVGTVVVGMLTAPKILERLRERKAAKAAGTNPAEASLETDQKIAEIATEQAISNPILRLFIDDLHTRLSQANAEAAKLHEIRAGDAATIARLTAQLGDKQDRLVKIEQQARDKTARVRDLVRLVRQLKSELEETRAQLHDCYREGDRRDESSGRS
jgi:chromosome segregation ATPase